MNTALWIVQGLLAAAFFAAGMAKTVTPKDKLETKQAWAKGYSPGSIKLIGLAEVLGAVGLIVPWWTAILPILTPVAAAALVVIMIGAAGAHLKIKESPVPPLILGILSAFVAVERGLPFLGH